MPLGNEQQDQSQKQQNELSLPDFEKSAPYSPKAAKLAVLVAALGYMVDIYDLILFSVVRVPSLRDLGVAEDQLLSVGSHLLNMQMYGMLVGGLLWGMLGDKRGRLSVLFGSILMYSLANIANGFVSNIELYGYLRFIAGIGLAGELGAGMTLVTELLDAKTRGFATTLVAGVGICGALLAVFVSKILPWHIAYWIGGALGLALLALRVGVFESGIFERTKREDVARGNIAMLFTRGRAKRYLAVVVVGIPIWFAIGVLVTFVKEIGQDFGLDPAPDPAIAVLLAYGGLAVGDFASGFLSQLFHSRRRSIFLFLSLNVLAIAMYFSIGRTSHQMLYAPILLLGVANGYWAVFATVAAEQFGTNLRATAATTAPNFVRGSVPLLIYSWTQLQGVVSRPMAACIVGCVVAICAFVACALLDETYGKDLDYVER